MLQVGVSGAEASDRTAEFIAALKALEASLRSQLEEWQAQAAPVALDEPIGRLSRMEALQQQSMAQASKRAAKRRLERVLGALAAAERGEYGICLECEEPIAVKRLRARPETSLCLDCQRSREGSR